jgi:hypothetical protein
MGWVVQGSNPGGGKIFCTCPDRSWSPPSFLYNGYWVFSGGKEWLGCAADHETVELYLYSPYALYGLYRASVPVQGCILPFLYNENKQQNYFKLNLSSAQSCMYKKDKKHEDES